MNETRKDQVEQPKAEKKPYARPQLLKQGNVESQTQVVFNPSATT